jgi:phosphoribosylformylglycinamidine (FGAM) synthase PurS component
MAHTHLFEIGFKPGVTDPVGQGLKNDIHHLGLARVKHVASAQLYKVNGTLSGDEKSRITGDLLCDPILHESRDQAPARNEKSMVLDVWYKAGVTDVVGDSVRKGIEDLGIRGVKDVRTGMRYHLQGVTRREAAERIALALLVNPLVHDLTISSATAPEDQATRKARHAD